MAVLQETMIDTLETQIDFIDLAIIDIDQEIIMLINMEHRKEFLKM